MKGTSGGLAVATFIILGTTPLKAETFNCNFIQGVELDYLDKKAILSPSPPEVLGSILVDQVNRTSGTARILIAGHSNDALVAKSEGGETFYFSGRIGFIALTVHNPDIDSGKIEAVFSTHFVLTSVPSASLRLGVCDHYD